MTRPSLVVIGDVLLDRDVVGTVERMCPDAPAPVVDVRDEVEGPGGAGLAALLAAQAGARVTLVAALADDAAGRRLRAALTSAVAVVALGHDGATRVKTRVRVGGTSVARLDTGGPGRPTSVPVDAVRAALDAADGVLVSDYGAGLAADPDVRRLLSAAAGRVPLVWDPHPRGPDPVTGAALVTPNAHEAGARAGQGRPAELARRLRGRWSCTAVAVTGGDAGAHVAAPGADVHVRTRPATGDCCGAGDGFAAAAAVALASGADPVEAVRRAVREATEWVERGGVGGFRARSRTEAPHAVPRSEVEPVRPAQAVAAHRSATTAPLVAAARVDRLAAALRAGGGTVVATGGCFDLLHAGHVATLEAAAALGDRLVVLVNSDASVERLKGPARPVVPFADRVAVLRALACVDAVVELDDDDPRALLARLRPDVWVKGGDYAPADLPEAGVVAAAGGRVVVVPFVVGRSTTNLIRRLRVA